MSAKPFLELTLLTQAHVEENTAFEKMQGYPLVNHGKTDVLLGLISMDTFTPEKRGEWVKHIAALGKDATRAVDLARSYLAHNQVRTEKPRYEKPVAPPSIVKAVGLSSHAYSLLEINDAPEGVSFSDGFSKRFSKELPDLEQRKFGVVLVLAWNEVEVKLKAVQEDIEKRFADLAPISWEKGTIKKNRAGDVRDHFEFKEGLSQPLFFDTQEQRTSEWRFKWNPSASLSHILAPEPSAATNDEYGSFMAYLKIKQDVDTFEKLVTQLAAAEGRTEEDVKSRMLGRDSTGKPLIPGGVHINDFDFDDDSSFKMCPASAHVRKVNPRTAVGRNHRILRRSALYDHGADDRGVLFQCFQSKLETGFEFVFRNWALDKTKAGDDADALVVGVRDLTAVPAGTSPGPGTEQYSILSVTKFKHGEYFYFPSIPFFERLESGQTQLIPELIVPNVSEALEFYKKAFGAAVSVGQKMAAGDKVKSGEMTLGGHKFLISKSGPKEGGGGVRFTIMADDPKALANNFVKAMSASTHGMAGATSTGAHEGTFADPSGHKWRITGKSRGSKVARKLVVRPTKSSRRKVVRPSAKNV